MRIFSKYLGLGIGLAFFASAAYAAYNGNGPFNIGQWAGVNLGSPSNYGTSPGAVAVQGVNAFVTNTASVGGTVATNVAITANPLNLGAQGVSSENSAVTTARQVQLVADLVGKLIVLPYANPENFLNGQITTAMTGTTSTAVTGMGAQGAGIRVYVTACSFASDAATVGTMMQLQDGSGGSVLWQQPAASALGGGNVMFPTPIRTTANTGLFAKNVTTGSSTYVSCTGYKGV